MSKNVLTFEVDMALNQLSKTKARELHQLGNKKHRDESGLFLAEGDKLVADMLPAFELQYLICTESRIGKDPLLEGIPAEKILVAKDKDLMKIVSNLSTQPDLIAVFRIPEVRKDIPELPEDKLYLLADGIQDPGNFGTIIRTADWFGVYDIFATKDTVDVYNPKVVQATMGSLSRVTVRYLDAIELIDRNPEVNVYGTLLNGEPLAGVKPSGGIIILGNEGNGISESLRNKITRAITIPPFNKTGHPDSLNVAIANAVVLSHFRN